MFPPVSSARRAVADISSSQPMHNYTRLRQQQSNRVCHLQLNGGSRVKSCNPITNIPKTVKYLEHQASRAASEREDALERLFVCARRLDSLVEISKGWLSRSDPKFRQFFRLVGALREKTICASERIAAFENAHALFKPFIYNGEVYLSKIGPDLGFLDDVKYLQARLRNYSATQDPLLALITPNSVPMHIMLSSRFQDQCRGKTLEFRMQAAAKILEMHSVGKELLMPGVMACDDHDTSMPGKDFCYTQVSQRLPRIPVGQSVFRMVEQQATMIQKYFRRHQAQMSFKRIKSSVSIIQTRFRDWWERQARQGQDEDNVIDVLVSHMVDTLGDSSEQNCLQEEVTSFYKESKQNAEAEKQNSKETGHNHDDAEVEHAINDILVFLETFGEAN